MLCQLIQLYGLKDHLLNYYYKRKWSSENLWPTAYFFLYFCSRFIPNQPVRTERQTLRSLHTSFASSTVINAFSTCFLPDLPSTSNIIDTDFSPLLSYSLLLHKSCFPFFRHFISQYSKKHQHVLLLCHYNILA